MWAKPRGPNPLGTCEAEEWGDEDAPAKTSRSPKGGGRWRRRRPKWRKAAVKRPRGRPGRAPRRPRTAKVTSMWEETKAVEASVGAQENVGVVAAGPQDVVGASGQGLRRLSETRAASADLRPSTLAFGLARSGLSSAEWGATHNERGVGAGRGRQSQWRRRRTSKGPALKKGDQIINSERGNCSRAPVLPTSQEERREEGRRQQQWEQQLASPN